MIRQEHLTYALNQEGKLVHVDSVPNGNECGCFCPNCKSRLCAKNGGSGEKMIHHFAHLSGADCVGAVESALHKMAKDILAAQKCIYLPKHPDGKKDRLQQFDKVEVEYYDKETNLRPDCIGYYGDKCIWVEFKRSHPVDKDKKEKIISARIDCIEIDLNNCLLDPIELSDYIINSSEGRKWIVDNTSMIRKAGVYHSLASSIEIKDNGAYYYSHEDDKSHRDYSTLREAAKEIICDSFYRKSFFNVPIPQYPCCTERDNCNFFNEDACCIEDKYPCYTDIKQQRFHYTDCYINETIPERDIKCDLVFKRSDSYKDAILVFINNKEDNYSEIAKALGYRIIKMKIKNDIDLDLLRLGCLPSNNTTFINFKKIIKGFVPRIEVSHRIFKFELFANGKYFPSSDYCYKTDIDRRSSTVYELLFLNGMYEQKDAKAFALYRCFNSKRKACYCEICSFIERVDNEVICSCHVDKGTPQYPLKVMPTNCPHFQLKLSLISRLEKDYCNIKIIER